MGKHVTFNGGGSNKANTMLQRTQIFLILFLTLKDARGVIIFWSITNKTGISQILFWEHSELTFFQMDSSDIFSHIFQSLTIISWAITDVYCHCCCTWKIFTPHTCHQRVCFIIFQCVKIFTVAFFHCWGRCKRFIPIPNPCGLLLVKYTLC